MKGLIHKSLSEIASFDLSIGQGKLLCTKILLLSSWNAPSKSLSCITSSLLQDGLYTSIPFQSLNLSSMQGLWLSHVCIRLGYFLLLIHLMSFWLLNQVEEIWG